ncbi:MAG: nitroreductase family protein [bacterium]
MNVYDAVLTNIAVREFTDEPLESEHLIRILDAARLCQSGKNLQPWYFIVIRDRSMLDALAELMKGDVDEAIMKRSHTAIAVISDPKSEFDVVDAGRAAQNMTLVAWELGIGSVFISGPEPPERIPYRKKAKQLLGIPDHLNLVDLIVFGYPRRRRVVTRKKRKELKDIVFDERFGHSTTLSNS